MHKSDAANSVQEPEGSGPVVYLQTEAATLKVPVRFLHQLRTLLPQTPEAADTCDKEDVWSDAEPDATQIQTATDDAKPAGTTSAEEGSDLEAFELQTAIMAAPQMLAATSGGLCCPLACHTRLVCPWKCRR